MRGFVFILALVAVLAGGAVAGPQAMVTRVTPEGEVVVNRGVEDQVVPGTRWTVVHQGKPVAEIEVVLVDSYTSRARLVQGSAPQVGDRVTTDPFPAAATAAAPAPAGQESPPPESAVAPPETTAAPVAVDARSAESSYESLRASRTRTESFSGGAMDRGADTGKQGWLDPINVLNMATSIGYGGSWSPAWQVMASTTAEQIGTNTADSNLYQDNQVEIQVTYWDEPLLESYADTVAIRENRTSIDQRLAMRSSLYAQKGLDRFLVFHVRIRNQGPGTVQLAPFHWHIYVVDAQGNRVKAERYDQVLDRSLNPDQQVEGTVYFMKLDVSGRPVVDPGLVKVALEDILGERAEMTFGRSK